MLLYLPIDATSMAHPIHACHATQFENDLFER
jgi:hypothetical protein